MVFARDDDGDAGRVVGMARLLSDGVCNAYLLDVWTWRPTGAGASRRPWCGVLMDQVPGQHVGLQTDDAQAFYRRSASAPSPSSCRWWWACGSTRARRALTR